MKKLFTILFVSFMVTFAYGQTSFTVNGIKYTTTGTNTVQVSEGGTYTGTIIIPSTVPYSGVTYNVTSIGYWAFRNCTLLTSVTIPSSVKSIKGYAFFNSTGLTSVTIPSSVTSIEERTFSYCTGLTSITIPSSVTSIGSSAFLFCSALTSVTIPSSVTTIGSSVFQFCSALTSVTIPSSVTTIGEYAFEGCSSLTSVTIPSSVTSIGDYAFLNCSGLTSVIIPSSVTSIGSSAFKYCSGLTSVTIPSSVTSIGDNAFNSCTGLTSLTLPLMVSSIGVNTFAGCSSLASVIISSSVTSIGNAAFAGCSSLTSVTIPSSVNTIEGSAFSNCIGLTSVTIPSSVTSISDNTFYNCTGLTSITIPSSVTTIGDNAFNSCTGLTMFTIPSSVKTIGDNAFYNCTGLTSVTIPALVTSIGYNAFYNCTGLTSITIPSSVNYIGDLAFKNCGGLITVDTGNLGYSSLNGVLYNKTKTVLIQCPTSKSGSFIIPSSVTTIGIEAYYNCSGLSSVTIPSSVTSIRNNAFENCTGLTTIIAYRETPIDLTSSFNVFLEVNKSTCILYIPSSTLSLYQSANQWKDFRNIRSIITTAQLTKITSTTASGGGTIIIDGGFSMTSRGVCWNTTFNPTVTNSKTADGSGIGTYSSDITGLKPVTTYHIRAYATNSLGTIYGDDLTFTTLDIIPTIITTSTSSITSTTATSGGNITTDGGFDVTARGVCWNTSNYPTIANSKTNDGIGTGSFISNITGLTPGTTYYIRAYATNIKGTAYGNPYSFTTLINTPILNTTITGLLTGTTVTTGGKITTDGGFTVTARGVCWNTTVNPTIANSKSTDGTGIGTFTSKITGLNPGTTYHVRAYATNSAGTAYGDDITFTTLVSSTEVYLNNIAFISSAQDGAQSNVPSTMVMNSSNPYNFMNPGKTIRFKMQCFNKKSNGINIVSGSCKVRCNDPYFTLTDSTSGLNNVGYNASAWSSDEFEIQIKSTTPWGYVGYVDFEVIEGSNSYFTYKVPIPIAPLSLQSKTVDDDNNPDSKGNGNGICEPNEIIESLPSLKNVSSLSANSVYGLFNNYYDVSGISIWNNKQGVSGTVVNSGYWNYAFGAPQVITAGTKDMIPQWDFVFDYNFTNTYHLTIGLIMSGKFQLFSAYQSYIRWLVPVEYNTGSPEFNTGIRNKRIQELTVYPNPTYGKIIIVLDVDIMNEYTINLSNVLGQKVYSSQLNTEKLNLDLSNYCSKGIYFLQLLNNKGIIVGEKKIIFN